MLLLTIEAKTPLINPDSQKSFVDFLQVIIPIIPAIIPPAENKAKLIGWEDKKYAVAIKNGPMTTKTIPSPSQSVPVLKNNIIILTKRKYKNRPIEPIVAPRIPVFVTDKIICLFNLEFRF
ncbi:MAG: hypothetical protein ACTSQL_12850 [Promethearchaeota archaeon]